jgi:hypothetical protein
VTDAKHRSAGTSAWLAGRTGSNVRMAESKSAEFTSEINRTSEFSFYDHPLTALVNFPRSESRDPLQRLTIPMLAID